jgi:hypothetical protein
MLASRFAIAALSLGCGACGSLGYGTVPKRPEEPAIVRAPESAAEIARDLMGARTGVLFEVNKFRFHPAAGAIGTFGKWAPTLEALELEPLYDVQRVFVTAGHAADSVAISVLELSASDAHVARALEEHGGARSPFAHATVRPAGATEPYVVALVRPGMVVIAPERLRDRIGALRVPAKLPAPDGRSAARFFAFEPSESLGSMPRWPATVIAAHAEIEFTDDAGAVVRFFADSTSAEQAKRDSEALTKEAHDLLTLDLALFELHLLDPPVFHASGRRITMETRLLPGDVDWILRYSGSG